MINITITTFKAGKLVGTTRMSADYPTLLQYLEDSVHVESAQYCVYSKRFSFYDGDIAKHYFLSEDFGSHYADENGRVFMMSDGLNLHAAVTAKPSVSAKAVNVSFTAVKVEEY